ncbi:MAG: BrnT family toxin [Desulfosarcina sp.]|nr:BrnT family toxin [Desulfobacterales bacterium]
MLMEFEWNRNKAAFNFSKHGVSFDEAKTVFNDPLYVDFFDPDHSYNEHRYIIIGQSINNRLLLVAYTERKNKIRLISVREATGRERKDYEEG